ncbi:type II toxin-antitoxin system HicB family antitoxin [bacterium]|nr:type II toxin-antitoxin system HicB family antitoxin [bacterium]
MNRLSFPVTISKDKTGYFLVKFVDIKGAVTDGKSIQEALMEAIDCLDEALAVRIKLVEEIPMPSKKQSTWFLQALLLPPKLLYILHGRIPD